MSFYDLAADKPSVFAVESDYFIAVPVRRETVMRVDVGDQTYYDHSNGVLRSKSRIHLVRVPMAALDAAKQYTVSLKRILKRQSYHSPTGPTCSETFAFRPVSPEKTRLNVMHIADSHSCRAQAVKNGRWFGDTLDLLILNGDVLEDASAESRFQEVYRIAGGITGGEVPCVFSRGNHDLRGRFAELFGIITPARDGVCYYTFRLGPLGGVVLDCGEDKTDDHAEYGSTVACHPFRVEETEYLKKAVREPRVSEAPMRVVVSHVPFTERFPEPFNIEEELYAEWTRLVGLLDPIMLLSGHIHRFYLTKPGDAKDAYGQTFPTAVASYMNRVDGRRSFGAAAITLTPGHAVVRLIMDGNETDRYEI